MEVTVNRNTNVAASPQVSAQTSSDAKDQSPKRFDAELLKDEKAAQGVARELAQAQTEAAETKAGSLAMKPVAARDSAEWSRQEGAPNWSTLSAQSKGYTFSERAINLYRHINAMAV